MSRDEQKRLAEDLISFVIDMAYALPAQGDKFAMHDDLWNANIMIDPQTKRLSGVIDFGKVAYKTADQWAPMYDFQGSPFEAMLQQAFDRRRAELPGGSAQRHPVPPQTEVPTHS